VTRVKICGLTLPADAVACRELGVDFIGMIFAGGPRLVTTNTARAIRDAAPDTKLVGVFADQEVDHVVATAAACRLDLIQLHGHESDREVSAVAAGSNLPVIKTVRAGERISGTADSVLFDLPKARPPGPDDRDHLWALARRAVDDGRQVFLAGKLTPADVAIAVEKVGPYALDVASGVEFAPGFKDAALMRRFIEEVRLART
jgi:phosphoribosylanthranilate isomerase